MSDTPRTDVVWRGLSCMRAGVWPIAQRHELDAKDIADLLEHARQLERELAEAQKDAEFRLSAQSREAEEARFYRYLRDEAGQIPDDRDGPMICSGLGDNFDYLRGEECDIALRAAIEAARRVK